MPEFNVAVPRTLTVLSGESYRVRRSAIPLVGRTPGDRQRLDVRIDLDRRLVLLAPDLHIATTKAVLKQVRERIEAEEEEE